MPDAFDFIADSMARERARESVWATQDKNPDAVGRANRVGRQLGIPAPIAEADLPGMEARAQQKRADLLFGKYPRIASWSAQPRHAALAKDDWDNLSLLGKAWQSVKNVGSSAKAGLYATTSGLWGVIRAANETQDRIDPVAIALRAAGVRTGTSMTAEFARRQQETGEQMQEAARPRVKSWLAQNLLAGIESVPTTLASLGVGAVAGPGAGLALAGGVTSGQSYGQARKAGLGVARSATFAASQGLIEAATERLPLSSLLGDLAAKSPFAKTLAKQLAAEVPGEQAATILQDLNDWAVLNPNKPFADYLKERPERAAQTLVATISGTATHTSLSAVFQKAVKAAITPSTRAEDAASARDAGTSLDRIMDVATESKVRQRDPQAFAALIERLAQGSGAERLFVPADRLVEYFQSADVDYHTDDFWGGYSEQIDQGLATGGDVILPTSEAAAHLAGTQAWEALRPDVRVAPGGMSLSEAEAFDAAKDQEIERMTAAMAAQMEADRAALEPRQKIVESVRDRLMQAGYTPDAALVNAELVAARYATRAARLGQELTGTEADKIEIRRVLPEGLAPAVAADQLDLVIAAMRDGKASAPKRGPSLLEWIAANGGIEDRGGDIAAMGGAEWHRGRPGRRKLLRESTRDQMAAFGTANQNTPDALAQAAWEAGYFPGLTERPDVNTLLDAIGEELRGNARHAETDTSATVDMRAAAEDLRGLLESRGLDADKATPKQIRDAVAQYQQEQSSGALFQSAAPDLSDPTRGGTTARVRTFRLGPAKIEYTVRESHGDTPASVSIDTLLVPQASRRKGAGRRAMQAFLAEADRQQMRVMLTAEPLDDGTKGKASKSALVSFYKSLGFKENKGRSRDLEVSYGMIREPALLQTFGDMPRGSVTFADGKSIIQLFESSNLSTFAHEFGHITLEELRQDALAATQGRLTLYHGSPRADLTLDQIRIIGREGQKQGKKGRRYGGFYAADESRIADAEGYAGGGGTVYRLDLKPGAVVEEKTGDITRLSEATIAEYRARGVDVVKGVDPRGRVEYAVINEAAIESMAPRDQAQEPQAVRDWRAVQDWFRANGIDVTGDTIPVEAHELWARGFERFLMEGKAPSTGLRRVFDTFRTWLLQIYKVVDNLRSPISPEIREVMERLIATDEEIEAAREKQQIAELFKSAADANMTEAEFAAYREAAQGARDAAFDALLYRTMQTIRQARTAWWRDEERGVRADVTERINRRPEFRSLHLLRTGRLLDNADAAPIRAKLDTAWLIQNYGEDVLKALPKAVPPIFSHERSMDADTIAEMAGFRSGDEMVRTLIGLEQRQAELRAEGDKRSVRQRLIDEETAAEMRDRHGDPLNDGSIEEEALAAVLNERQGEVIASELRALQRKRRAEGPPTPYSLAKEWAARTVREGRVVDVASPAAVQRYARAAAKAAKEAEAAMLKGDVDETYRQKQRQMLNAALVSEARKAGEAVDAAVARLGKLAKRATMKSVDQDYLDQAHALLEQVEFRNRSQASLDRQESFAEWARQRQAEGHDVVVPDSFAESLGTTHWSRLSVEQLLGLDETVKQIIHFGRLKQQLIDAKEEREFNAVVDEAVASAEQLPPKPPQGLADPTRLEWLKSKAATADAALLKMETVFDWLDGGNSEGVFNRVVFKPIAEAQAREQDLFKDYAGRLEEALALIGTDKLRRLHDRVTIPELIDRETGLPVVVNRKQLLSMALNMGNAGNAQRLADGYGWNEAAILDVLNRELSAEEWRYVQQVWDIIDGLWPEIEAMEKRLNGVPPEKVEARTLDTTAGTLRGGYFPVVYDSARDYRAEQQSGEAADLFESKYTRATTRASATKERLEKVSRPVLLDLGVITRHVGEVIHDITHREAVMNADRFLSSPRVMKAVDQTLGREVRQQFRPWLKFVANQWAIERSGNEGLGAFIGKLRSNATVVGLGFRATTVMMQLAGYSNSFEAVGARWVGPAMAQALRSPVETFRFVMERSGEVRHRMDTIERDINEGIKRLAGKRNPLTEARRFAFHGIGYTDRLVVIPTWLGAYNKALSDGLAEEAAIYAADKAVRQSQGAGAAKDMAAVQRGTGKWGEALKLFTMFYSYMSAVYQRQRTLGRDVADAARSRRARDMPALLARAWWLVAVPPLLAELMAGRGPDDDEDWGWWAFSRMLFQFVGAIPILRDVAPVAYNKLTGKPTFGYSLSPLQKAGESITNVAADIGNIAEGEDTTRATRNAMEAAGYWTGLVPGQLAAATQFLVDVGYGDQDPQSFGDWYEGLTTGRIKDD